MKSNAFSLSIFTTCLLLLGATVTRAQNTLPVGDIPRAISYQGILTDKAGEPFPDGSYQITLSLYADPAGTIRLWQETYNTSVIGGLFNLYLGNGNRPLPDPSAMNTPLWVGTQVGDGPEMSPLTLLSASAYALNVPDRAITTGKLADGAVTAQKVDMPYISGVEINNHKVEGVGTVLRLKSSDDITLDYDETTGSVTIASNPAAKERAEGDPEKGREVQDVTDANNNWKGRDVGPLQPTFGAPLGTYNAIAGGSQTYIGPEADFNFIGGGETNLILSTEVLPTGHSTIGGGEYNRIFEGCDGCIIAGGNTNQIQSISRFDGIAGGRWNIIEDSTASCAIGGGHTNLIETSSTYSVIGGGEVNTIVEAIDHAVISGGKQNTIQADFAAISGGFNSTATGKYSAITGGEALQTTGYAQTAVGFFNASRGSLTSRPGAVAQLTNNDPIFMVGNGASGGPTARSNAFEVSYNGHTLVYQSNGGTLNPIAGATYSDNIPYGWGEINANGTIRGEFGIIAVNHPAAGVYEIEIAINDPTLGIPIALGPNTPVAVTATLVADPENPFKCGDIRVTHLGIPGPNKFTVYTIGAPANGTCSGEDSAFMFHVLARPVPAPNL